MADPCVSDAVKSIEVGIRTVVRFRIFYSVHK